ncbi:ArsR/SmtB family transcription factor [Actinomadura oligospora]|uniref:ArsR/SmtB family transcription factor n=1 Tax=Actinomadura oligospora TaxID=111804 RepID=UPI00047C916E|nr:winged helix-turn-helix domain-containing protein [Actinomadura oligospora]
MRLNLVAETQDLGHTRIAVSPLQNLVIGFWGHQPSREARAWQRARRRLVPHAAAPLLELINAHPWYVPDFLTPVLPAPRDGAGPSFATELEALRSLTEARILEDLRYVDALPRAPRSVRELREGSGRRLAGLVDGARSLFRACLAEDWPGIEQRLRADIAQRGAQMATAGPASMLSGLSSRLTWRDDATLTLTFNACRRTHGPEERTISLSGHGLLLMPSPFTGPDSLAITGSVTSSRQAVIAYHATAPTPGPAHGRDALTVLVGRGRARALRAVQGTATTTELAGRLGVGKSTASEHASALRAAGLITTHRAGRSVRHTTTELGRRLLADGGPLD